MSVTELPTALKSRKERDARYNRSEKGRERTWRYERTAKALKRKIDCDRLRGRDPYIQEARWAEVDEWERSGSELSLLDWLNATYPLPKLRRIGPA